ncbi:MAG: class I SAM-dependent methyltransferase [Acidimicrobiales bacterium]|nr:class I SAM-dependent methyltransferase [Acidimicrobiales bacterium]
MDGFDASTYGESFADTYDRWYGDLPGLEDTVAATARLAEGRPVLELGCGTGRLCLPLAGRGVVVHGLDSSDAMLQRLVEKDPTASVVVHRADMSAFDLPGAPAFGLAFLAFNSLFNLPSAEAQAGCFASVARHLAAEGRFALECVVPGDPPSRVKDAVDLHSIGVDRVVLRVSRQNPADQTVTGQHVEITEAGIRLRPWFLRYATLAELDAMADAAGFALEHRWADWAGTPFGGDAVTHVSVYRLGTSG